MAIFLNTERLNYWIPKLIEDTEKELILLVPYIQTSKKIIGALQNADSKNVQIILVYRENSLNDEEKNKLLNLKNLTLLHHPNLHCKTYFNGELLIVGSMNLYEYSQKNNREMGILCTTDDYKFPEKLDYCGFNFHDDYDVLDDAIDEIRQVINSAQSEITSVQLKKQNFEIDIIKSYYEIEVERCARYNKHFLNKKFVPFKQGERNWVSKCENFYDKVDVVLEDNRITIELKINSLEVKNLYENWKKNFDSYEFNDFKYYWNGYDQPILLYRDWNLNWKQLNKNRNDKYYNKINTGINNIINKYRILRS